MISKDFTHTWALANYFATDDNRGEIPNNPHVEDEEQHDSEEQQGQTDWEKPKIPTTLFFSANTNPCQLLRFRRICYAFAAHNTPLRLCCK